MADRLTVCIEMVPISLLEMANFIAVEKNVH